jgi:Acetyltransferase (GNAT) domain
MTKPSWQKKSHSLYFGIGPLKKKMTFTVAWLTTPFPDLSTDISAPSVTQEEFAPDCEAAVIEAHPYDTLPSAIEFRHSLIRYSSFAETRFLIDLRGTFADYMKKFAAKPRHNILGEVRRLTEFSEGDLDCRLFSTPDEIREFRNLAVAISDKSYQRQIGMGFNSNAKFADSLVAEAALGFVRGYVLFSARVPIAYAFCRTCATTIRYVDVGYDPEFRKWSPGSVLLYQLIEKLHTEGAFEWLDLEFGSWYDYKKRYSTHQVPFVQLWYFPANFRNRCIVYAHSLIGKIEAGAVQLRRSLKKTPPPSKSKSAAPPPSGHAPRNKA